MSERDLNETEIQLAEEAIRAEGGDFSPENVSQLLQRLGDPEWDKPGRSHDWRDSVPEFVIAFWPLLSLEAKLLMYVLAVAETEKGYGERDDIDPDEF